MRNYYITNTQTDRFSEFKKDDTLGLELHLSKYSKQELLQLLNNITNYELFSKLSHILVCDAEQLNLENYENLVFLCKELHSLNPNTQIYIRERFENYPLKQALQAERKAYTVASQIEARTKDQFEQVLLLHDYTASRMYKHSECRSEDDVNFIGAMTTDSIVCMGYAKIFQKICNYLGIECEVISTRHYLYPSIHCLNLLKIISPKYNINDYYISDPTWDSTLSRIEERSYLYSAYPIQDLVKPNSRHSQYFNQRGELIYTNGEYLAEELIDSYSPIISLDTFEQALNAIYPRADAVKRNLKYTINEIAAKETHATNCFALAYQKQKNRAPISEKTLENC